MNLIDFSEKIKNFDDFIIIPHINPDGDAVGSALALCDVLRKIGKTAYVADISENMPKNLGFIDVCGYTAPENLDELCPLIGPPLHESFMKYYGVDEDEADKLVDSYRKYYRPKGIFECL